MIYHLKKLVFFFCGFLIITGCVPELELTDEINENTTEFSVQIPGGFDFKTHDVVTININDSEGDAFYEIFSENRNYDPQIPDSLQLRYNEVKNDDLIFNSKFKGRSRSGLLEVKLTIPSYANKIFIRRKGSDGFTNYIRDIIHQKVNLNHYKNKSANKSKGIVDIESPLTSDVYVIGDASVSGGLNTNGFDLEVTGSLIVKGSTNLSSTSTVTASTMVMSGRVNLNGGNIFADQITIRGNLNGSGYLHYCTSYAVTGIIKDNQVESVIKQQCESDSDGDGINDNDDAFPDDNTKAYYTYSPSETEYGVLLFEDLWPSFGDYDFNDVSLKYQTKVITNAQNEAVQIDVNCMVKVSSSNYVNGIGIELRGLDYSQVESVSGTILTQGYITNNSNGTEAGQNTAVIILTDNADNLLTEKTISIKLKSPTSLTSLGESPFNPFIISNETRGREIHLPNQPLTSLGASSNNFYGSNYDSDNNYLSDDGFSWGLSILEDIPTPKEAVRITEAYNYFKPWAESKGKNHKNWYKNLNGHRNKDRLNE